MRTKTGNKEQRILEAAVAIFARDGYHHSRISDIAELAGISVGSVYLYFDNKESILNRLFSDLWARLVGQLKAQYRRQDLTAVEKLDIMIDLIFNGFIHHADLAVVFVNEQN
ncbi:MAG TPA: TetR/AcrR family transcriptional regulator, partial [bacterium]|nr:TetR/AcrR family transcriptional regulator [bacterium]